MGKKYLHWHARSQSAPQSLLELQALVQNNRDFRGIDKLSYGDHGLELTLAKISEAIRANKRIALYADYDVDGTMSAVSWIWFLEAIGHKNFIHYIPCRFKEGYGVNLTAITHLIDHEKAQLIITMDTGITANEEAAYCRQRGVDFICTDHHKIQKEKMPDCIILNPKMHPDLQYQELCGCGITFVLLRRLAESFAVSPELWTDLLALAGMATICDVVPLNSVNHRLARMGVQALLRSRRPVLKRLREACALQEGADEKDVGFRLGPRINAVGRLQHADAVIAAFIGQDPEPLIHYMGECNDRRKVIQQKIVSEAMAAAQLAGDDPILFLGGDWHPGVVGIAASKVAESFWRPTWLFMRDEKVCKGSARSIAGFDVTEAMGDCGELFLKFGGHRAAGGFSFDRAAESEIRAALNRYAGAIRQQSPDLWQSRISYDCVLPQSLIEFDLLAALDDLKPFGHGFEEPRFLIEAKLLRQDYFYDKQSGAAKHSVLYVEDAHRQPQKVLFFGEVIPRCEAGRELQLIVAAQRNSFRGRVSLDLHGVDWNPA